MAARPQPSRTHNERANAATPGRVGAGSEVAIRCSGVAVRRTPEAAPAPRSAANRRNAGGRGREHFPAGDPLGSSDASREKAGADEDRGKRRARPGCEDHQPAGDQDRRSGGISPRLWRELPRFQPGVGRSSGFARRANLLGSDRFTAARNDEPRQHHRPRGGEDAEGIAIEQRAGRPLQLRPHAVVQERRADPRLVQRDRASERGSRRRSRDQPPKQATSNRPRRPDRRNRRSNHATPAIEQRAAAATLVVHREIRSGQTPFE